MDRFGLGAHADLVTSFLGHLVGAAVMFIAMLLVAWGLVLLVHLLHTFHPFPDPVYKAITTLETWLVYTDMAACGIVLAFGARKLLKDALESTR